jgi:hypothetical protein
MPFFGVSREAQVGAIYRNVTISDASGVVIKDARIEMVKDVTMMGPVPVNEWTGSLPPPNNTGLSAGSVYTVAIPGFHDCQIKIRCEPHVINHAVEFEGVGERPRSFTS